MSSSFNQSTGGPYQGGSVRPPRASTATNRTRSQSRKPKGSTTTRALRIVGAAERAPLERVPTPDGLGTRAVWPAKYSGSCAWCKDPIYVGDKIAFVAGRTSVYEHSFCVSHPNLQTEQESARAIEPVIAPPTPIADRRSAGEPAPALIAEPVLSQEAEDAYAFVKARLTW